MPEFYLKCKKTFPVEALSSDLFAFPGASFIAKGYLNMTPTKRVRTSLKI